MSPKKASNVGPVPECDDEDLDAAFLTYVKEEKPSAMFDLGEYKKTTRSNGAKAKALIGMKLLILSLMSLGTMGRFKPTQLGERILHLTEVCKEKDPPVKLNNTSQTDEAWASFVALKISVALYHVRQCIHSDKKFSAAMSQLKAEEDQLAFAEIIKAGDPEQLELPAVRPESRPKKKARVLKPHVSLDSNEFPKMLVESDDDSMASSLNAPDGVLLDADGFPTMINDLEDELEPSHKDKLELAAEKAAAEPLTVAKGSLKKQLAAMKRPAASGASGGRGAEKFRESTILGKMKITPATGSSYICHWDPVNAKWSHVITVRHGLTTAQHQSICWSLLDSAASRLAHIHTPISYYTTDFIYVR